MFEVLKQLPIFARSRAAAKPQRDNLSKLEFLFATREGSLEVNRILRNAKNRSARASMNVAATVLGYAGHHAARMSNVDQLKKIPELQPLAVELADLHERLLRQFDRVFVETAALHFHKLMHPYWDGYDGSFCADEEDLDGDEHCESLIEALDFADDTISGISPMIPKTYLRLRALSYEEDPDAVDHACEKFAAHVVNWIFPAPEPAGRLLMELCIIAAEDLNPARLDELCRQSYAHAFEN